jgi:hypothetical protein
MSEFSEIIPLILEKKYSQANELLEKRMYKKLGKKLEESLLEYAPTVFMNPNDRDAYLEEMKKSKEKKSKPDEDGDGVPDYADEKAGEDDNPEDSTEAGENKKGMKVAKEDYEVFLDELTQIVEDIENELGEELSEEEIAEIASELLSEEADEDDDFDNYDDDEDSEEEEICENCGE